VLLLSFDTNTGSVQMQLLVYFRC